LKLNINTKFLKEHRGVLLILGVYLVIAIPLAMMLFPPQLKARKALQAEVARVEKELQRIREGGKSFQMASDQEKEKWKAARELVDRMPEVNYPKLLAELTQKCIAHNIEDASFTVAQSTSAARPGAPAAPQSQPGPAPVIAVPAGPAAPAAAAEKTAASPVPAAVPASANPAPAAPAAQPGSVKFGDYSIKISFHSQYPDLGLFLKSFDDLSQWVAIESCTVSKTTPLIATDLQVRPVSVVRK
jgi:hypothetical protein